MFGILRLSLSWSVTNMDFRESRRYTPSALQVRLFRPTAQRLPRCGTTDIESSIASHSNNPLISFPAFPHSDKQDPAPTQMGKRCIRYIQHYCNEHDMVARWGPLNNIELDNRYSGTIFVRLGATGHMFDIHYMAPIFPIPSPSQSANSEAHIHEIGQNPHKFLDQTPHIDDKLALQREDTAMKKMGLMRDKSTDPWFLSSNGDIWYV